MSAGDEHEPEHRAPSGQPYGVSPSVQSGHVKPQVDVGDLSPSHGGGARGRLKKHYGKGPAHLLGHLILIAITGIVLSIIFRPIYGPEPLNLALWLLGGAVLHDAVFLPVYGVINALFTRVVGAGDGVPLKELAMGPPAGAARREHRPTRDHLRRVPVINYVRSPLVISLVLFLVFLPRLLNRQPQNFVNALGHQPPDFFMRWVWVTIGLFVASALLYAVRWARAGAPADAVSEPAAS